MSSVYGVLLKVLKIQAKYFEIDLNTVVLNSCSIDRSLVTAKY